MNICPMYRMPSPPYQAQLLSPPSPLPPPRRRARDDRVSKPAQAEHAVRPIEPDPIPRASGHTNSSARTGQPCNGRNRAPTHTKQPTNNRPLPSSKSSGWWPSIDTTHRACCHGPDVLERAGVAPPAVERCRDRHHELAHAPQPADAQQANNLSFRRATATRQAPTHTAHRGTGHRDTAWHTHLFLLAPRELWRRLLDRVQTNVVAAAASAAAAVVAAESYETGGSRPIKQRPQTLDST